ncbi:MAG: HD domain-containing protein [Candidatus Melainabacteria bacterium]
MVEAVSVGKIIRCPVHDLISVDSDFALRIINSRPMQRLRRIKQLGLASFVYPGADHSRFSHSLGAYHLATIVMNKLNARYKHAGQELPFDEIEYEAVSLGALMHDLGHGPFSHMFESVAKYALTDKKIKHEHWTKEILLHDSQIQAALVKAEKHYKFDISKLILDIFDATIPPNKYYLRHLLSSQLDVDRFDYLLRDSLMTGAKYGEHLDFAWILRNLDIGSVKTNSPDDDDDPAPQEVNVLYIDGTRGLSSVESYLLGCFFMYKHVYYHKVINAAESMMQTLLRRVVDIIREGKMDPPHTVFEAFGRGEKPTVQQYLSLTDYNIWAWLEDWQSHPDEIVQDLSKQLLARKIFGGFIQPDNSTENKTKFSKISAILKQEKLDPSYYLIEDSPTRLAYTNSITSRQNGKAPEPIWIKHKQKGIIELDGVDSFVIQAEEALKMNEKRWYVPKNLEFRIKNETGLTQL